MFKKLKDYLTRMLDLRTEVKIREPIFVKPLRPVKRVYIHCSASDNPKHDDIEVIRDWHVNGNGWSDVGYNYFIQNSGNTQLGRSLERTPAAQAGHNQGSIAICLHGLKLNKFNYDQKSELFFLCQEIRDAYEGKVTFHGHCEVSNKSCPVIDYKKILDLDDNGFMKSERLYYG